MRDEDGVLNPGQPEPVHQGPITSGLEPTGDIGSQALARPLRSLDQAIRDRLERARRYGDVALEQRLLALQAEILGGRKTP